MKPFSGLYPQFSAAKLHPTSNGLGPSINSISKSTSNKNFSKMLPITKKNGGTRLKNETDVRARMSRSIEQIPHLQIDDDAGSLFGSRKTLPKKDSTRERADILIENCQEQENELFSESYSKLNKVYKNFEQYKNKSGIEQQLSQVLHLIRDERTAIKNKLHEIQMKKSKRVSCTTTETGQNTQQMLVSKNQISTNEIAIQTEQQGKSEEVSSNQTYSKLIKILQDMNINSRAILPQEIKVQDLRSGSCEKKYQELKESEIITVQKFVIKKLVQRISALQSNPDS